MLAIVNGKIYTMAGEVLEKGTILVEGTKIKGIGTDLEIPKEAKIIDAAGKVIMPGIIDAHSHIGIFEEGMGFEGADGNEMTNPSTPHLRAIDAINPMDSAFVDAYKGGITTVVSGPGSANVIGGLALAMKTYGKIIDEMVILNPSGLKCAFGENPKRVYNAQKKMPTTRMGTAAIMREELIKAQNYLKKLEKGEKDEDKAPERDLKMESLVKVLKKEIPLRAHAHRADDIVTALRIAEEFDVNITIEHCTEGHLIADYLGKKGVSVIIGPTLTAKPKIELQNLTFETGRVLYEAGVKFAIMTDHPVIPQQYLPICAALAHKDGLPEEEALKAITINAAEIIGVADRVGSLEVGKDADIIILSGHLFDYKTVVEKTIINGEIVYER
ncbi:Imidazolonepropionase [Anaerobranca californiensis DSM 14826]|uniref:Imidazolonepropionase n=1 Tax=Anaerobranca californiensis DSM 14826 TaxID=1120989 RepID=A0A1M6NU86_9FIRM|nr:amidohydrolase [Anaerobranca californiensis]SHJ99287.1 Imidazolonepropionase [Anaerobranca californiensis DSM 14826]